MPAFHRQALGIAVFSGMLGVTIFGLFFTPAFYLVVRRFSAEEKKPMRTEAKVFPSDPPPDIPPEKS